MLDVSVVRMGIDSINVFGEQATEAPGENWKRVQMIADPLAIAERCVISRAIALRDFPVDQDILFARCQTDLRPKEDDDMTRVARRSALLFAMIAPTLATLPSAVTANDAAREHAMFRAVRRGDLALLENLLRLGTAVRSYRVAAIAT